MNANDARAKIVNDILDTMEQVGSDWTKSWATIAYHKNAQTGRSYNGINAMWLSLVAMVEGYKTPLWLTWSQMKAMGCHPKADQWKASHMVMWVRPDTYVVKDDNGQPVLDDNGEPKERNYWRRGLHEVWNVEQTTVKASTYAKYLPKMRENRSDADIDAWCAMVREGDGCSTFKAVVSNAAYYVPSMDTITVPELGQFESTGEFYSTLFHEMAHSTGHKSRLGRGLNNVFGSSTYAQEELVAELTSAIICSEWGIEGQVRHAQYLNHWLHHCRKDASVMTVAASQAQKAVEFMTKAAERAERKTDSQAA